MITTARTHPKAMIWSRVTTAPKILYVGSGWLARPGADVIVSFPNRISAAGGGATDTPTEDTRFISGDGTRRCEYSTRYKNAPNAGPASKPENTTAGSCSPACVAVSKSDK